MLNLQNIGSKMSDLSLFSVDINTSCACLPDRDNWVMIVKTKRHQIQHD